MEISNKTIKNVADVLNELKDSAIIVTGATGMLGQNIVSLLLKMNDELNANITVIAHVRSVKKANKVFGKNLIRDDFSFIVSDIATISYEGEVNYIIHTAGVTGGSKQHIDKPLTTISTALQGTQRILDLAVEKKCLGLVYLSTLEVYGNMGFEKDSIFENEGGFIDSVNVRSSYSESKRMCECLCASYTKQYGVPTYVARLTASFGYGVSYTDNRVFAQFARCIIEGRDIVLKSTGETVRNYCDAEDVATACLYLLARGKERQPYNVANMCTEISIKDMAKRFIELFPEKKVSLIYDLKEDSRMLGYNAVLRSVLNSKKIQLLGWKPLYNMDEMIRRLVNAMKSEERRQRKDN